MRFGHRILLHSDIFGRFILQSPSPSPTHTSPAYSALRNAPELRGWYLRSAQRPAQATTPLFERI